MLREGGKRSKRAKSAMWRSLVAAGALVLASCIAPTLPVPPPSEPDVSAASPDGVVTVTGSKGSVTGNAEVEVWNQTLSESAACKAATLPPCNPGVVTIAHVDGSYVVQLKGKSKDTLYVRQTVGSEQSTSTETQVP